jgi:uncharacterized protein DUF6580
MLAYLFVLLAVAVRLMPHPLAFTPVTGALLYFGARGPRRQAWVPVVLLMASDLLLNKFVYAYSFTWDQVASWIWYGAMLWVGSWLRDRVNPLTVVGSALAGSVSFFVFSNFASWATWTDMYPRTVAGLMACYAAGVPFFRRAVEGDLLFTCAMFALPVVLHFLSGVFEKSGDHTAAA